MKTIIVIIASIVLMGCSRGVCDSYRAHNVTSKNQTSGFVKNIKKNLPVNFPTNLNISDISAVSYTPVTNKDLDKGLIYLGPLGV